MSLYRNIHETWEFFNVLSSNIVCKPLSIYHYFLSRNKLNVKKHCFVLYLIEERVGHRLVAVVVHCHHPLVSDYLKGITGSEWASLSCHSQLEEWLRAALEKLTMSWWLVTASIRLAEVCRNNLKEGVERRKESRRMYFLFLSVLVDYYAWP